MTGASGGIGEAIVGSLLERGFRVAAADVASPSVWGAGPSLLPLETDVTDRGAVERAAEAVYSRFGAVDVLVNAAGIFRRTPFSSMDEAELKLVLDVNLAGTLRCMAVFARKMMVARSGRIINIASIAGQQGAAMAAAYAASKAGVIAATASAGRELAPFGVRVNAIAPGFTDTPMLEPERPLVERFILPRVPAGRLARPEEIAEVVLFLATCRTDYLVGSTITMDGGLCVG